MQKYYTGNAAAVSLSAQLLASQTTGTFTVSSAGGWPTGGPFTVAINRGQGNEEKLLCTRSGTTFTIVQRAFDGTGAQTHGAGSLVEHVLDAEVVAEASAHANGAHYGSADHTNAHYIAARNADALVSTYPDGTSVMGVGVSETGWPIVSGTVLTQKAGTGRVVQTITNTDGNFVEVAIGYIRYGNASGANWSTWQPLTNEVIIGTATASGVTTVTFSNIPQNFRHLRIVGKAKYSATTSGDFTGRINGGDGAGYSNHLFFTNAGPTLSSAAGTGNFTYGKSYWHTGSPNCPVTFEASFPNYSVTGDEKTVLSRTTGRYSTTYNVTSIGGATWSSTAPITSIEITGPIAFAAGTTFTLRGIL